MSEGTPLQRSCFSGSVQLEVDPTPTGSLAQMDAPSRRINNRFDDHRPLDRRSALP